jgi:hypothetical protein
MEADALASSAEANPSTLERPHPGLECRCRPGRQQFPANRTRRLSVMEYPALAGKDGSGRCPACNRTIQLRQDGRLITHKLDAERCAGSGTQPNDLPSLASWLPLCPSLTPHGLRHGHQTWLDDLSIRYVLQSERMGHEVPGMRGVYTHITPRMRGELRDGLQELWTASLHERLRAFGPICGPSAGRHANPARLGWF